MPGELFDSPSAKFADGAPWDSVAGNNRGRLPGENLACRVRGGSGRVVAATYVQRSQGSVESSILRVNRQKKKKYLFGSLNVSRIFAKWVLHTSDIPMR